MPETDFVCVYMNRIIKNPNTWNILDIVNVNDASLLLMKMKVKVTKIAKKT